MIAWVLPHTVAASSCDDDEVYCPMYFCIILPFVYSAKLCSLLILKKLPWYGSLAESKHRSGQSVVQTKHGMSKEPLILQTPSLSGSASAVNGIFNPQMCNWARDVHKF